MVRKFPEGAGIVVLTFHQQARMYLDISFEGGAAMSIVESSIQ